MAQAKKRKPIVKTPVGRLGFSHLAEPDTKGQYADNKYKAQVLYPKEGADNQEAIDAFVKQIKGAHKKAGGNPNSCPVQDGDTKNHDNLKGLWIFKAKTKFPPVLADVSGKELAEGDSPWGGDTVVVSFQPEDYNTGGSKGLTCRLKGVQRLKKGEASLKASDLFEDESEGWGENTASSDGGDFGDAEGSFEDEFASDGEDEFDF